MNDLQNRVALLLGKYRDQTTTALEENELYELIASNANEEVLKELLLQFQEQEKGDAVIDRSKWERVLQKILENGEREVDSPSTIAQDERLVVSMKPRVQLWKRIAVAASIVGVIIFAGYWFLNSPSTLLRTDEGPSTVAQDVPAPDKNRAQIKLADGTIVYLDSAANGELADMNGVVVKKTEDGKIVYEAADGSSTPITVSYNTLSNPRGSKVIDMTLSDGSRVWLNAGSSVTYPIAFIGKERNVTITGEAYFEIAHDKTKPFRVSKGETTVEVLGTHFNVNAYDDESEIKVTLLEGSVNVSTKNEVRGTTIKPGEQAIANPSTALRVMKDVDVEQVMAWKNGSFVFGEAMSAEEIMRQIARWYDVEVVYAKKPSGHIGGSISRNVNITKVLQILEATGMMQFKVEGRKVTLY